MLLVEPLARQSMWKLTRSISSNANYLAANCTLAASSPDVTYALETQALLFFFLDLKGQKGCVA